MNREHLLSRNINALDLVQSSEKHPTPFIKIYDGFFSSRSCDKLVQFFKNNKDSVAHLKTMGDIEKEREWAKLEPKKKSITARKSWGLDIDNLIRKDPKNKEFREIHKMIFESFDMGIKKYLKDLPRQGLAGAKNFKDENYFITKYDKGDGHYSWHSDRGLINKNQTTSNRFISAILYLNDVSEGGETEFWLDGFKVKPRKGRLLLFPSGWSYIHRGIMPISGDKYICNNFFSVSY
jgi:hypothetical protein